ANNPVLRFNDLTDQTGKDEQEGMMHLFEGAVLALRNPRAHSLFDESPELALDYIGLLSLLAKRLDGAKR
ncbi:MAG: TIGR02391 family protein, partial [Candidatus Binataceae bacterium]